MSEEQPGMAKNQYSKYLTAALLGLFAVGLFLFTLYAGLK